MIDSRERFVSRREVLKQTAAVAVVAVPLALVSSKAMAAKVAQDAVGYVNPSPNENKCGTCTHFEADANSCKVVDGDISAEGWCSLWAAKS